MSTPSSQLWYLSLTNSYRRLVLHHMEEALSKHHSSFIDSDYDHPSSREEDCSPEEVATSEQADLSSQVDWTKFILLLGKPGTGKTHTVCTSVRRALEDRFLVAVVGPTGFLASLYRAEFDQEALIDTVHAMLHYPIDRHVAPSVNWSLRVRSPVYRRGQHDT